MEARTEKNGYGGQIGMMIGLIVLLAVTVALLLLVHKQQENDPTNQERYDASKDIEAAMALLADSDVEPELIAEGDGASAQKFTLVFEGLASKDEMETIVSLLSEYGLQATFSFSGLDVLNAPEVVEIPADADYTISNSGYSGGIHMEGFSQRAIVSEICRGSVMLESVTGNQPETLVFRQTTYTDEVLTAAAACGINQVLEPTCLLGTELVSNETQLKALLDLIPRGSILCVRLSGTLNSEEEVAAQELLAKLPDELTENTASSNPTALKLASWIMSYLHKTDFDALSKTLVEENDEASVESVSFLYTTARAVAFTFSGLGGNEELVNLLNELDQLKGRALFFVSQDEMDKSAEQIDLILSRGHSLGISVHPKASTTAEMLSKEILLARETLSSRFNYSDANLIRQSVGIPTDALQIAASATGSTLCLQTIRVAQDRYESQSDLDVILTDLFGESTAVLMRGSIVHFQLGFFQGGERMLGDLVHWIATQRNIYPLESLSVMLRDTEHLYTYPLPEDEILPEVKDAIHPGQLTGNAFIEISRRYIGTPWLSVPMLPGFTRDEVKGIDAKGMVKNDDNAVFLSFDDWGTDANIDYLLQVLRAYNVKTTFFVRTNNIHYNPNLLRAIAEDGHEIAAHTHEHRPLSIDEDGRGLVFRSLNEQELADLETDLVACYDTLQSVVGDLEIDGRPALTKLFRPPTQAVSKEGLTLVLDCGYTFSVSGSCSTQDYLAKDAQSLARTIRTNCVSGSVIVMHMSDNSKYTADALALVFQQNELAPEAKRVKFARLGDYLEPGSSFR